jgi:hypothetical protein
MANFSFEEALEPQKRKGFSFEEALSPEPARGFSFEEAAAPTPTPVAEKPASRGFELPPVMDPFGINKPAGAAVAAPKPVAPVVAEEEPAIMDPEAALVMGAKTDIAPERTARVRTARDQEFAPGSELVTGVKAGAKGLANLPAIFALQQDASTLTGDSQKRLDAYAAIDAGKEFTRDEVQTTGVGGGLLQRYRRASPEQREELKAAEQERIGKAKVGVQEGLKLYAQYTKEMQQYQGRTPDATDIETATDFANWLAFNVGSGAVQLAPVILAAVTTGAPGAFAVGTALAGQETLQNRLEFVLEKNKDQPPQEQADAVANYLRETGDVNAMVALASGALDLAGPVGTILKKQFAKEMGKEAVQYATKTEAAKAAVKRAPRELVEEGLTGGAQEGVQITGEFVLEEQVGPVFSEDNIKRVFNAAAAEAAGSLGGTGFNVGTAVGQQYVIEQAKKQTAQALELQVKQALQQANADELGPVFDSLVAQVRAEKPGISEIDAFKEAGSRLIRSGGVDAKTSKAKPGRGKPSVSVPVGDTAGTPTTTAIETTDPSGLAATGVPVGDVGAGTQPSTTPLTDEAIVQKYVPSVAVQIRNRAFKIVKEGKDQGATISRAVALQQAETEMTEGEDPAAMLADPNKRYVFTPEEKAQFDVLSAQDDEATAQYEAARQALDDVPELRGIGESELRKLLEDAVTDEAAGEKLPEYRAMLLRPDIRPLIENLLGAKARADAVYTQIEPLQNVITRGVPKETTGETLGTTTPQAQQTETQRQAAPDAGTAVTPAATQEATNLALRSVDSAVAEQTSFDSLDDSLQSFRENVVDTLAEQGITDQATVDRALAAFDAEATKVVGANRVPLDQVTETTPASQLPANPATGLKPPGKRGGGRKPVERTPEQQAAADQQRKDRQKVGRDSIRTAEKAKAAVDKPFNVADYDTEDAARAAAIELQQERDAALVSAYRILNDKSLARDSKAKQIAQQVVDSPVFDADNRARAQNQAKQTDTARSELLGDSTDSQPDTFYEGVTDATQAIDHVIKTGNAFERLLAQRIKPFLKGVKVVIVNNPKTDIPNAKNRNSFKGAMGLYVQTGKQRTIYLSNLPGLRGINNMTFLHEAVHGATMAQINAFIRDPSSISPQARAAIADMNKVMLQAYKYYAVLSYAKRTDPLEDGLYKLGAFTDLKEFVAYGLTQPEMQDFLMKVPGQYKFDGETLNRGLLTKFVQSIRKMFGMGPQSESAFQDLVVVTDRLLRAGAAPASKSTITALAKKVTAKQNKTLAKLAKSNTATDLNASIGELMMETRSAKDAVRLLRAAFDALNVRSIRAVMPTMTTMDITRWAGDRVANLKRVNDAVDKMAGMRAKMIRELAEKVPAWAEFGKKYEQGGRTLGDVMNASTLLNVDPTLHANLADALNNDPELQKAKADYQAALANPTLSPKQRSTVKGQVTKRENELKAVYEGGTVVNPHTGEKYVIEGWDKLGTYGRGEGHRIYKMARDAYRETFDLHQQLLIEKITKANIPGKANDPNTPKGKLIAQITQTFQEAQQLGVYFPLMRYGNYWLRIGKGKAGEFYMFESATARNNYARQRADELKRGYDDVLADQTFEVGDQLDGMRNDIVESSQMLKDIFKAIEDGAQIDPITGRAAITDVDAIKDQVYQMYLMTLPDRDIRRKFTHRQGKTGFSADVLRNFVTSQHTAANQLARLAYADEIRLAIGSSYAELAGNPDGLKLAAFVDEIALRATAEMTPQIPGEFNWDQLAAIGNQAVFFYMLTSPKSALIQMTQLPIVGLPVLVAEYGAAETAKVTARYSYLFNKFGTTKTDKDGNVTTKWGEPSINDSKYINEHPDPVYRKALKLAWQAAQDRDMFMSTYAADMTSRARAPTGKYEGGAMKALRFTGSLMGGAFHHLERIARETMYMSTFELAFARAKKDGLTDDAATKKGIKEATHVVYESLFNYSQYNKPRLMKAGAIPRLATQFMTYPLQMTSFLVRNFYKSLPFAGNRQEQKEAAIKFFGTIGMTGMFAGVVGLPGYSMIMGMAEGVREALRPDMDDEDEDEFYDEDDDGNPLGKRNLDLWFREWFLPTYFGPDSDLAKAMGLTEEQALMLQRGVKMGPISAVTDLNIGSSVSLDGLWFRDDQPAETSKEAWQQFVFNTLTGPFGAMGEQIFAGFDEFNNGQFNRALEKWLPAFFRGIPKALRQSEEGEQTRQGAEVRNAEWYTTGKLLGTTLGFQSTEIAEIQKKNFMAKRMIIQVQKERTKTLADLDLAVQRYDNDPSDKNEERLEDALVAIDRYNYKNGMLAITGDTVSKSLEGRAKRRGLAIDGLMVSPKEAPFVFPLVEKSSVTQ